MTTTAHTSISARNNLASSNSAHGSVNAGKRHRPQPAVLDTPLDARMDTQGGAVTAEMAVAMPVLVLLLVVVLTLVAASSARLGSLEAARAGARAAAIGYQHSQIAAVIEQVAGPQASFTLEIDDAWVTVHVSRPVVGGWFSSAPLQASAQATAWREP